MSGRPAAPVCTISLIARTRGYALGMNRDEKLTRVTALPPRVLRSKAGAALRPREPGGGTWIVVNDAGVTLALINWYAVSARVSGPTLSRGEIVASAAAAQASQDVDALLARWPLPRVNPFRLIGVFPGSRAVIEWRWNLDKLQRRMHPWRSVTWISSGYDEPGAQRERGRVWREAGRQASAGRLTWLRRLHASHGRERGPYSHCMHRVDAATVSYAEVVVSGRSATMRYAGGPPCSTPLGPARRLRLRAVFG